MACGKLKCRALAVTISIQAHDTGMDEFRVFQRTQTQARKQRLSSFLHAVGTLDGGGVIFGTASALIHKIILVLPFGCFDKDPERTHANSPGSFSFINASSSELPVSETKHVLDVI